MQARNYPAALTEGQTVSIVILSCPVLFQRGIMRYALPGTKVLTYLRIEKAQTLAIA